MVVYGKMKHLQEEEEEEISHGGRGEAWNPPLLSLQWKILYESLIIVVNSSGPHLSHIHVNTPKPIIT